MKLQTFAFLLCSSGLIAAESSLPSFSDGGFQTPTLSLAESARENVQSGHGNVVRIKAPPIRRRSKGEIRVLSQMPVIAPPESPVAIMPVIRPDPEIDYKLIIQPVDIESPE